MSNNLAFENDDIEVSDKNNDENMQEVNHASVFEQNPVQQINESRKDYIVVIVLFIINLLNYIDRFTIAGVLDDVNDYYGLSTKESGMIQTAFIITYMIMSPIFGYLGDRTSRKWLIIGGITFWSVVGFISSFIPKNMFWLFIILRSLVGVGEASYSTVAPTILADMFTKDKRTKVMAFFYFAVPLGSGLGFILGYALLLIFKEWQYALRFSPLLGIICVVLLLFLVREPERGRADGGTHLGASPWLEDLRQLSKNHSFMLISFGFTCVCFVIGSLVWYAVLYINAAIDTKYNDPHMHKNYSISFIFGATTMVAGIFGVIIGTESARRLRTKFPSVDPVVCACGMLLAGPLIIIGLALAKNHLYLSLTFMFLSQLALCLNWALVTDSTMSVVIPTRRSTAAAYQMVLSHAFGDAGSPYIIGAVRDAIKYTLELKYHRLDAEYYSMQYALLIDPIISIVACGIFLQASLYILKDKARVQRTLEESRFHFETVGSDYEPEDSQLVTPDSSTPIVSDPNCVV